MLNALAPNDPPNLFGSAGRTRLFLWSIIAVTIALRVWGLDWGVPEPGHNYSYQGDEMTWFRMLREMNPSRLDFFSESYAWLGPVFPISLGAILLTASKIGLVTLVPSIEYYSSNPSELGRLILVGRCFVATLGVLTVILTYHFASQNWSRSAGVIAAAFVSVIPIQVYASRFLLADIPAGFFALASVVLLVKFARSRGGLWAYGTSVLLALIAISIKLTTAALFSGIIVAPFFRFGRPGAAKALKTAAVGVLALVTGTMLIYPSLLSLSRLTKLIGLAAGGVGSGTQSLATWPEVAADGLIYAMGPMLVAAFAIGAILILARRTPENILLFVTVAPMLAILLFLKMSGMHRYAPLYPFIGVIVAQLFVTDRRSVAVSAARALAVAGLLHAGVWSAALARECGRYPLISEARDWINENIEKETIIGVPRWHYIPQISMKRYRVYTLTGPDAEKAFTESEYYLISDFEWEGLRWRLENFEPYKEWKRVPSFAGIAYNPPPRTTPRVIFPTTRLLKRRNNEDPSR